MNPLIQRLSADLQRRREQSLLREIRPRLADDNIEDLSNNDYLRLARDPRMIAAARSALETWGVSSSASPLISGYTGIHRDLEDALCTAYGYPACLLWNSGYTANQAILGCLPQKGDLVLADRLIHNSMISGILRSGARLRRYPHLDLERLQEALSDCRGYTGNVFVVTESVFSMDGDYPDLREMAALKRRHGFIWMVDEAHALGWYGARGLGLLEEIGCLAEADIIVGTFGKGLGSMGAFTMFGDPVIRDWMINHAGEFIYSTYFPPACAAAALKGLELSASYCAERPRWRENVRGFRQSIHARNGDSPIVPVPCRDAQDTLRRADILLQRGWRVGAVRPPTVPPDGARLRLSLHRLLGGPDLNRLRQALMDES